MANIPVCASEYLNKAFLKKNKKYMTFDNLFIIFILLDYHSKICPHKQWMCVCNDTIS